MPVELDHGGDEPPSLSPAIQALFVARGASVPAWKEVAEIIQAPDIHPEIRADAEKLLRSEEGFDSFKDHAFISSRSDAGQRLAFHAVSRLLGRPSFEARRALLESLPRTPSPLDDLVIAPERGLVVLRPEGWDVLDAAVAEAKTAFATSMNASAGVNPGKTFMSTAKIQGPPLESKVMALGRHPGVLRLVGRYLGGLPILARINLLRSSNDFLQDNSSQFFHIDPEDFRQMKLFVMISDVTQDTGPLHLLDAEASDTIRVSLRHTRGRLSDKQVFDLVGRDPLTVCTGPSGTMAFGDTCRCFHFGSRPGERERLLIMYQYLTPFSCSRPIDADVAHSNYAGFVRHAEARSGRPAPDLDRYLFALER